MRLQNVLSCRHIPLEDNEKEEKMKEMETKLEQKSNYINNSYISLIY